MNKVNEEFKIITDNMLELIYEVDENGKILYASPSNKRLLGYNPNELIGKSILRLVHPRDIKEVMIRIYNFSSYEKRIFEFKSKKSNGEYVWVEALGNIVYDEEKKINKNMLNFRIITKRKDIEKSFKKRFQYEKLLNQVFSYAMEDNGIENFLKKSTQEMEKELEVSEIYIYKNNEEDKILKNIFMLTEEINDLKKQIELISYDKIPNWINKIRDGKIIYYDSISKIEYEEEKKVFHNVSPKSILIMPLYFPGEIYGVIVFLKSKERWLSIEDIEIFHSISMIFSSVIERNYSREILKYSEELYRGIFENASDIICTHDIKGNCISVNKRVESIIGYTKEEFLKTNIEELILPEYLYKHINMLNEECLCNVKNGTFEIPIVAKDKNIITLDVSIQCIYKGKSVAGFQSISRDVSKRKKFEEELKKSKESAEANNKAKSQFLANMSHEIRTPLNAIIGMTELTLLTDLNKDQRENIEIIKSSGETLLYIINNVLDFSKIEAGKINLNKSNFKLRELAEKTIKSFIPIIQSKHIELSYHIQEDIPDRLMGDEKKLQQILNNIIGNAIKFTDYGRVVLYIEKYQILNEMMKLKFSIKDTGIGISPHEMKYLFKSFSQVDGSMTRKYEGTGLGLAISKELVQIMQGEIWVESKKNVGSTFNFTIVFDTEKADESKEEKNELYRNEENSLDILLIEDNKLNQLVTKKMLNEKGHIVTIANNGLEGLNILEENDFDVILMDIQMPHLDGIKTTKKIREKEKYKNTPIIALTARAIKGEKESLLSLGMDDYIAKPIKMQELFESIKRVLNKNKNENTKATLAKFWNNTHKKCSIPIENKKDFINQLIKLKKAIEKDNFTEIEKYAQIIKVAASNFNISNIKNIAFKIQLETRKGNGDEVEVLYEKLENYINDEIIKRKSEKGGI